MPNPTWNLATAPLHPGKLLLEASAGTGKTYCIERLVALLIAEVGLVLPKIVVVTYTNAAAAELRGRIRALLAKYAQQLGGAGPSPQEVRDDVVLARLAASPDRVLYAQRLHAACEGFDAATIATIHAFCQATIVRNGLAMGARHGTQLVTSTEALRSDFATDVLSRERYADAAVVDLLAGLGVTAASICTLAATLEAFPTAVWTPAQLPLNGVLHPVPAWSPRQALDHWRQHKAALRALLTPTAIQQGQQFVAQCQLGKLAVKFGSGEHAWQLLVAWMATDDMPDAAAKTKDGSCVELLRAGNIVPWGKKTLPPIPPLLQALDHIVTEFVPFAHTALLLHLGQTARDQMRAQLDSANQLTFSDLLHHVADALRREATSGDQPLLTNLRASFDAALIDEFQDTDDAQWAIFDAVFGRSRQHRLYLVGDPKQAIYRFRGADVFTYTEAAHSVDPALRFTLATNHRSDRPLVEALNRMYRCYAADGSSTDRPGIFGTDAITYPAVSAAADARMGWPAGGDLAAPLCVRWFTPASCGVSGDIISKKDDAKDGVCASTADDIAKLLTAGAVVRQGPDRPPRLLAAGDIAVLVRTNKECSAVQRQLAKHGIAAVISSGGSVLASEQAQWLAQWLRAVDAPTDEAASRLLAISPLFGWTAHELLASADRIVLAEAVATGTLDAGSTGAQWVTFRTCVAAWRKEFDQRGFFAAWQAALDDPLACAPHRQATRSGSCAQSALATLLATTTGARAVTNLRHLAELAHAQWLSARPTPSGLLQWTRAAVVQDEAAADAAQVRLETDQAAVQIVTVHKAKGLEYGVVFVPFLWDVMLEGKEKGHPMSYHLPPDAAGHRGQALDLGRDRGQRRQLLDQAAVREAAEESLRLLYVALTRARHQCVVYWGLAGRVATNGVAGSPLAALWHGEGSADRIDGARARVGAVLAGKVAPADLRAELAAHLCACDPTILLTDCALPPRPVPIPLAASSPLLAVHPWRANRSTLSDGFRRWSYSSFHKRTAKIGEANDPVAALPEQLAPPELDNDEDTSESEGDDAERNVASAILRWPPPPPHGNPIALDLPGAAGKDFGTWVHAVLEHLDFVPTTTSPPQWRQRAVGADGVPLPPGDLLALCGKLGDLHGVPHPATHQALAACLPAVLQTRLGGGVGDVRLADLALTDRLDELQFDFKLADGGARRQDVLAPLVARHAERHWPIDMRDNWRSYLDQMQHWDDDDQSDVRLHGLFTGSIDLVFRAPHSGQYFVVDYKTNRLAGPRPLGGGQVVSLYGHYAAPHLLVAMADHHYVLQYHLYLCALHRFLQHRLADYDYDKHIGGAVYLFVRGMKDEAPRAADGLCNGAFFDRPPKAAIEAMADALQPRRVR